MSKKSERFQSDIMATITQTVIDGMQAGTAPWQKPWDTRNNEDHPINLATGNAYHGLNAIYLDNWISALQNDVKYLWDAASRAEKAANWLIDEAHKIAEKEAAKKAA